MPPDDEFDAPDLVALAKLAGLRLDDARAAALLPMVQGLALAGQRLSELAMPEAPAGVQSAPEPTL